MTLMTNDPYDTDKVCGIYYMDENESCELGIRVPIDEVDNMDDKNPHGWNSMRWMKLTKSWKFHVAKMENYVNGWRCVSILGIDRYMPIPFSYPYKSWAILSY